MTNQGLTIWLTGLPSSGKSTIARELFKAFQQRALPVELLDGDVVRTNLSKGLGFSKEDRDINIKRIGFVSQLLTKYGVFTIVAAVSPYRETRDYNRRLIGRFFEVYVKASSAACEERDVKGLYKKVREGEIQGFTGIDDDYEEPLNPEWVAETETESVDESVQKIITKLESLGYLPAKESV